MPSIKQYSIVTIKVQGKRISWAKQTQCILSLFKAKSKQMATDLSNDPLNT